MRDLEQALGALGRELELPPAPDLAVAVGRRLRAGEAERRAPRPRLLLAAAALAAVVAAAAAVPQARSALLELLGLRGATVERVETLPPVGGSAQLAPGEPVSFARAQRAVDFRVLTPPTKDGGRCGAVFLDRSVPGGLVSVVCPAEGSRRLVLTQFRGTHAPYVGKLVGPGTDVTEVDVAGVPGLWIEGAPHVLAFRDRDGEIREHTRRLAGDVLLWERGGVTYRLEGHLGGRDGALRLAGDLR